VTAAMVPYTRTRWYGLAYFTRLRGSLLVHALPSMLIAALIAFTISMGYIDYMISGTMPESPNDSDFLHHVFTDSSYIMQLYGLVFGYLSVARLNECYRRFWEGCTAIKTMHSKWSDACLQILTLDSLQSDRTNVATEPFCVHVVRLFSQLSALATMRLHVDDRITKSDEYGQSGWLDVATLELVAQEGLKSGKLSANGASLPGGANCGKVAQDTSAASSSPAERRRGSAESKACRQFERDYNQHRRNGERRNSSVASTSNGAGRRNSLTQHVKKLGGKGEPGQKAKKSTHEIAKASVRGGIHDITMASMRGGFGAEMITDSAISMSELSLLQRSRNPVDRQMQRIIRAISTRHHAGGLCAPAPIVSRIFQELSNGMLAYNQASKLKEVSLPFSYVQFNAALLSIFIVTAPLAISAFTDSVAVAVIFSALIVGSFTAMWLLANEMEDPFGSEPNDMPVLKLHEDFCAGLHDQLVIPWLPEDTWRVTSGKWINPGRLFGAKPAGFSGANHSASPQFTMAGFGSSESHEEESEEIATPRQIDLHRFSRKSAHKLPAIMASDDEIAGSQRSCASSASPSVAQAAPLLPKQNASQSSPRRPPQSAAPSAPCTPQRSTEGLDQLRAAMQTAPISSQLLASRSNSRIPLDA